MMDVIIAQCLETSDVTRRTTLSRRNFCLIRPQLIESKIDGDHSIV
jgi:hypothetical protein